jgi:peptidoglycan L-alanyl-D-glutamate endopeptidase CwlK
MDQTTIKRIALLHPSVRQEMTNIINECNSKLTGRAQVRISQGLRTFAEQDALFAKTPKVTNAKGGQSVHNYGFAVDIVLIVDGFTASWDTRADWDNDKVSDWDECVKVFTSHGWSWGGNWTSFKDMPHFDKIGFNNWRILANKKRDSNNYIIV